MRVLIKKIFIVMFIAMILVIFANNIFYDPLQEGLDVPASQCTNTGSTPTCPSVTPGVVTPQKTVTSEKIPEPVPCPGLTMLKGPVFVNSNALGLV